MISEKIKAIRILLGLTETQISSLLFISSYRYRRCEKNEDYITVDILFLLSIIYNIPLDYLLLSEYTISDIENCSNLIEIVILNGEKKIHLLGRNLCHFLNENKVTFSSIKSFSDKLIKRIAENLKQAREERRLDIGEISALLSIDESTYMSYETGNVIITIGQLQKIADQLNVSVNDLLNM